MLHLRAFFSKSALNTSFFVTRFHVIPEQPIKADYSAGQDMSVEAMVQTMIDDLTATLGDAVKHDKGNAAAGTRVRKAMQDAKSAAQAVRAQVQADKNA